MSDKVNMKNIICIAGAYLATAIGSGFATGQEILQFFASQGYMGLIGALISMVLFSFLGAEVITRGRELKLKEPTRIYTFYCGKILGKFYEWFSPIFLFGILIVMISGVGSTLTEYYGINPYLGRVLMAVATLITVSMGLEKLVSILGRIGPVIAVFTIAVGLISLFKHFDGLSMVGEAMKNIEVTKASESPIVSGVIYNTLNIIVMIVFLTGMGASIESKKDAFWGGLLGGIVFMTAGIVMYLAMISDIGNLYMKEIPSLYLADNISPIVGVCFSVALILGIYTTAVPLLWSVTNRIVEDEHPKFKLVTTVIAILACIGGFLPFGKLVNILYPYTGYMGLLILVCMVYKAITCRKKSTQSQE